MSELREELDYILENPIEKIILSNGAKEQFKKIVLTREKDTYAVEKFTDRQVFHERIPIGQLECYCENCMESGLRQLNAFSSEKEYSIKFSKKGRIMTNVSKHQNKVKVKSMDAHKKNYFLEKMK